VDIQIVFLIYLTTLESPSITSVVVCHLHWGEYRGSYYYSTVSLT